MTFLVNPFWYPPNTPVVVGAAVSSEASATPILAGAAIAAMAVSAAAGWTMTLAGSSRADGAIVAAAIADATFSALQAPAVIVSTASSTMTMAGAAIARGALDSDAAAGATLLGAGIGSALLSASAAGALTLTGSTAPSSALSLNHFNGSGSTYTDEAAGITWTEPNDTNPAQQGTTKQFGAGALSMTGLALGETQIVRGSGWTSPHAGSWTAELWAQGDNPGLGFAGFSLTDSSGNIAVSVQFTSIGTVSVGYFDSGGTNFLNQSGAFAFSSFLHLAVVCDASGGTYSLFANGTRLDHDSNSTDVRSFTRVDLEHSGDSIAATLFFDEWRLTGAAQYSGATYTVPTSEFS